MMQLPRLDDANFEFWKQSVRLIANAMRITKYIEAPTDINRVANDDDRRACFMLTNAMLTSMSDKSRRIATGAGKDEDLAPFEMLSRLEGHYMPATKSNDIQLRRQLYTMKYTSGKPVEVFANEIRALANRINSIEEVRAKKKNASPALVGEHDMIAVLISSLPNEYDTEVTLIEREEENTFEKAVELIRNREQRLRTISNEGTANSVQGATNGRPKLPPCDVCGKNGHSSAKCFKNPNRRGAGRGGNRGQG
jgi:hypothetical protein